MRICWCPFTWASLPRELVPAGTGASCQPGSCMKHSSAAAMACRVLGSRQGPVFRLPGLTALVHPASWRGSSTSLEHFSAFLPSPPCSYNTRKMLVMNGRLVARQYLRSVSRGRAVLLPGRSTPRAHHLDELPQRPTDRLTSLCSLQLPLPTCSGLDDADPETAFVSQPHPSSACSSAFWSTCLPAWPG